MFSTTYSPLGRPEQTTYTAVNYIILMVTEITSGNRDYTP